MGAQKNGFILVSHVLPPSTSGQAVILQRLLEGFSPNECILLSAQRRSDEGKVGLTLNLPTYTLPTFADTKRMQRGAWILVDGPLFILQIMVRAKLILKQVRTNRSHALVVCTGDFSDMASAYIASLFSPKTELIPYYFDYFRLQFPGIFRVFSSFLEKKVMRRASRVIVPNESMGVKLEKIYSVSTIIVRNAAPFSEVVTKPKDTMNIFYSGSIYEAHYDVFRAFVKAIHTLSEKYPTILFRVFTSQKIEVLSAQMIEGPSIDIQSVKGHKEIIALQKKAALLYLPLAFQTDYPEIIETSCPGKMAEYLDSGVPIFAHVPKDCFVSNYLTDKDAAFCVNTIDEKEVAQYLEKALTNKTMRDKVIKNARICAKTDFNIENAVSQLRAILS